MIRKIVLIWMKIELHLLQKIDVFGIEETLGREKISMEQATFI